LKETEKDLEYQTEGHAPCPIGQITKLMGHTRWTITVITIDNSAVLLEYKNVRLEKWVQNKVFYVLLTF
jgi:hypothetical protein